MKKTVLISMIGFILFLNSGCATYLAKQSWNDAQERKAIRVEANGDQVMVGLDLTSLSYLKSNWPMALGAGILDVGLIYGTYYALDELSNSGSSDNGSRQTAGRDSSSVSIKGDGNTVQIRGDESTFGQSSTSEPLGE